MIKTDPGPVKVRPVNPGGLRVPNRDKLVYGRMHGKSAGPGEAGGESGRAERLLPPPEQPLPKPRPKKEVAKEIPKTKPVPEVPTVKDVAAAIRPAPPPQAPTLSTAEETKTPALAPIKAKRESEPKAEKLTPPVKTLKPAPKPVTKPAPKPEPKQATTAKPAPKLETSASAPIPSGRTYLVQLAAARSPQGARSEWERLRKKHLDLLGDLELKVTKADLGARKGVFYRLRVGPLVDEKAARQLCQQLTRRQVGCLIIKPVR